jgi:hypothetical protein
MADDFTLKTPRQEIHELSNTILGAAGVKPKPAPWDESQEVIIGPSPAPATPVAPVVPGDGFAPATNETDDDVRESDIADLEIRRLLMEKFAVNRPQTPQEILSGRNPAAVGGQELIDQTFKTAPELASEAMYEGAKATEDYGNSLADHYKRQAEQATITAADIKRNRELNEQEIVRRETELKDMTAKYTQDLSDTGKFWKNPGNILSAIGFALAPMGSDDPTIGIRLLDNAIQGDLKQRKQLADMHLGELRSNLSMYRSIAKDKEAGDILASSEAYRIAALQVEQISQSFQGTKAKAAAKAMVADLMQKSNISAMEVYKRIYMAPTVTTKPMANAYRAQPGFTSFTPQAGTPGAAPPGFRATGGTAGVTNGGAPVVDPATGKQVQVPKLSPTAKYSPEALSAVSKVIEKRAPGLMKILGPIANDISARAMGLAGPNATSDQVSKKAFEITFGTDGKSGIFGEVEKINAVTKDQVKNMAGISRFQQDLRDLVAAFNGDVNKANQFMGTFRTLAPGAYDEWNKLMLKMGVGDKMAQNSRDALLRLRQAVAGNVNAYIHDTSGGSVSEGEGMRMKQVADSSDPVQGLMNFANGMSERASADFRHRMTTATDEPLAHQVVLMRIGKRYPGLNVPGAKPQKGE